MQPVWLLFPTVIQHYKSIKISVKKIYKERKEREVRNNKSR